MMNQKEKEYLYWLSQVPGIGSVKLQKIGEYAENFEAVYHMKEQELKRIHFLNMQDRNAILEAHKNVEKSVEEYHRLSENGIQFITVYDEHYPGRLKNLPDKPAVLYVKGSLPSEILPTAAIIGARSCTYYGRTEAEHLGKCLAEKGIQVVSGLAYGIDGAGHRGVLRSGGAAFAVLGSGIDNCYPRENWSLYNEIPKNGGIISEYGPGVGADAWHFPVRNRIISGFSDVVIVVEARKRSGSLITVSLALEQGKEIFALPGRVSDPLSMGCNELIQDGANMLLSPENIINYLGINVEKKLEVKKISVNGLAKNEKKVYSCLDSQPKHVEHVVVESGLPAGECKAVLLKLELEGCVVQTTNQYYVKKSE